MGSLLGDTAAGPPLGIRVHSVFRAAARLGTRPANRSGSIGGISIMQAPASRFADRFDAGRRLARALEHLAGLPNLLVLALPRGGVPVAFEVARALQAPLDIFVVRKLGVPFHEELAMGAVASGGLR